MIDGTPTSASDRKRKLLAQRGILTEALLALAISVGETAPLIYTAGWSNYLWDGRLTHSPIGYLTYVIWTFINEPFVAANALAYAAAFLVTFFVLAINLASRLVLRERTLVAASGERRGLDAASGRVYRRSVPRARFCAGEV